MLLVLCDILVVRHVRWRSRGCVAERETNSVIHDTIPGTGLVDLCEDGFALIVVSSDKSLVLRKLSFVCHFDVIWVVLEM